MDPPMVAVTDDQIVGNVTIFTDTPFEMQVSRNLSEVAINPLTAENIERISISKLNESYPLNGKLFFKFLAGSSYLGALNDEDKKRIVEAYHFNYTSFRCLEKMKERIGKSDKTVYCEMDDSVYSALGGISEVVNVSAMVGHLNDKEKGRIGHQLIRKGLSYKETYKNKTITIKPKESDGPEKAVAIYFPAGAENVDEDVPTMTKIVIATGRATAALLAKHNDMPPLGLSVGFNYLLDASFPLDHILYKVGKESIMLVSIPKIKPHKCLNLTRPECYLFLIFAILNDANSIVKTKSITSTFTADVMTKITSLGVSFSTVEINGLSTILADCVKMVKRKTGLTDSIIEVMSKTISSMTTGPIGMQTSVDLSPLMAAMRTQPSTSKKTL